MSSLFKCQSCQKPHAAGDTECSNCGWQFENAQAFAPTASIPVRMTSRPKQRADVEIAITIDRTGSSRQFAVGIPKTVQMILRDVEPKVNSVTTWLQSHGDEDHGQQPVLHTDGGAIDQVITDLATISFSGGGPPDEDHLKAFDHLANTTPFSGGATTPGVILALVNADSKPLGDGRTARQLGEELTSRGLFVYVVGESKPSIVEFVDGADGILLPISNTPDPDDLQMIAARIGASIEATIESGSTTPVVVN